MYLEETDVELDEEGYIKTTGGFSGGRPEPMSPGYSAPAMSSTTTTSKRSLPAGWAARPPSTQTTFSKKSTRSTRRARRRRVKPTDVPDSGSTSLRRCSGGQPSLRPYGVPRGALFSSNAAQLIWDPADQEERSVTSSTTSAIRSIAICGLERTGTDVSSANSGWR